MKPKIISIKCPNCQKRDMDFKENSFYFKTAWYEKEWFCLDCPPWVWPNSWFNELTQYEHLVKRDGEEDSLVKKENVEI